MSKINYIPEQTILGVTPSNPDANYVKLYKKSDGHWYDLDSAGNESVAFALPIVFSEPAIVNHVSAIANDTTTALTKTVNITTAGDWLFTLSFNYNTDSNGSDAVVYATFDGNAIDLNNRNADPQGQFQILRQEAKDNGASPAGNITGSGSGQKMSYNIQFLLSSLTTGNKNLVIDIGSEVANVETSIWNIVGVFTPCEVI